MTFKPQPKHTLTDAQTLHLSSPEMVALFTGPDRYCIKSPMLCAFMDELEETGYVYNARAQVEFEKVHSLYPSPLDGEPGYRPLATLVYNCQGYRRHDQLVRDGWRVGTEEMLREAFNTKRGIMIIGESMLGNPAQEVFKVREINGKLYALRPNARKFAMKIIGHPCKIVPLPKAKKQLA